MSEETTLQRVGAFERTVATCLCVVPFLFSAQCFFAAMATPVFKAMFADFGSKLPGLTELVAQTWPAWAAIAVIAPIAALIVSRKAVARTSLIFSTTLGLVMFVVAQTITLALFLPIFQLGAVASGGK